MDNDPLLWNDDSGIKTQRGKNRRAVFRGSALQIARLAALFTALQHAVRNFILVSPCLLRDRRPRVCLRLVRRNGCDLFVSAYSLQQSSFPALPRDSQRFGFSSNLARILFGQVASGCIALLIEVFYTRLLGPDARGLISLCLMSAAFGVLLGGLGGEGTITYWRARHPGETQSWLPAIWFWGLIGSALAVAAWVGAYWKLHLPFLHSIPPSSARLVALAIPASTLFLFSMSLLTGAEDFAFRSANVVLRQIVLLLGFVAAFFMLSRNPDAALWGNILGFLIPAILTLYTLRKELRGFWRLGPAVKSLMPVLRYGVRGQVGNLATFFTYRLDIFVISYFLPLTQLGYYALGVSISEVLWQIPSAAASALFPRTARSDAASATAFTCLLMRQLTLLTFVFGAAIALGSLLFVPVVFGSRFRPSIPVVFLLLPGTMALSLAKLACSDLAGRGKNGYASVFAFVCLALTAILDWWFIPRWGILGAAAASSISYLVDSVLVLAALRFELRVAWRDLLFPRLADLSRYLPAVRKVSETFSLPKLRAGAASLFWTGD